MDVGSIREEDGVAYLTADKLSQDNEQMLSYCTSKGGRTFGGDMIWGCTSCLRFSRNLTCLHNGKCFTVQPSAYWLTYAHSRDRT
jgi:hypothetical protein